MLNLGMNLQRLAVKGGLQFTPASLFNNGEAGVWYDPSAASGSLDWRRNLLEYTESFDNSYWTKGSNSTLTPNYGAAPDGNQTAYRLQMPASGQTYFRADNVSVVVGKKYTFSIYAKSVSGTSDFDMFNQVSGTYVLSGTKTATSEWQRFSFTTSAAVATASRGFGINNDVDSYATDILIWGWQVEEASTASSYQPILSTFESAFKAAFPSHTLYQDYQGVTPVTAVGEPVGLMLDKSEGLAQGPEQVTNGDFATDSNWTKGTNTTIANGQADFVSAGADALYQNCLNSKLVRVTFDIVSYTSGALYLWSGGNQSSGVYDGFSSAGPKSLIVDGSSSGANGNLIFGGGGGGFTGSIDNISVTEIQGSHATQPTSTKRPIYARHPEGGIRNLLNYTEQFDNGYWTKQGSTITANATIAPDGTTTADKVSATSTNSWLKRTFNTSNLITFSCYYKAAGNNTVRHNFYTGVDRYIVISLSDGSVITGTGTTSYEVEDAGNGWWRVSITVQGSGSTIQQAQPARYYSGATNGTDGVYAWGAQLEEATEASNYQKVVTDIDVTESGVGEVYYLKFDGTDDGMLINNLTSTSTPLTALFGYSATNAESASIKYLLDIQSGRTVFAASANVAGKIGYYDGDGPWSEFDADSNAIKVLTYDLVEDNAKIRIDGTQEYSDTTYYQRAIGGGVGLYQGNSGGGANIAGNMYQTILRAAESTDEEIAKAETYVANKTGLKAQVDGIATLDLNFGANLYTAKNSNGGVI